MQFLKQYPKVLKELKSKHFVDNRNRYIVTIVSNYLLLLFVSLLLNEVYTGNYSHFKNQLSKYSEIQIPSMH